MKGKIQSVFLSPLLAIGLDIFPTSIFGNDKYTTLGMAKVQAHASSRKYNQLNRACLNQERWFLIQSCRSPINDHISEIPAIFVEPSSAFEHEQRLGMAKEALLRKRLSQYLYFNKDISMELALDGFLKSQ